MGSADGIEAQIAGRDAEIARLMARVELLESGLGQKIAQLRVVARLRARVELLEGALTHVGAAARRGLEISDEIASPTNTDSHEIDGAIWSSET